jgi:hypothetical protein
MVGCAEMQSNHVVEPISLGRDQQYASTDPVEGERAIEIHAPMLFADGGGGCVVSVHSAMKSARAWDLFAICGM